jgi:uronate dehydrogenase
VTVLVTGAAGRIGTMLRERLPSYGWHLRLLDVAAIEDAQDETVRGDITDPAVWDEALAEPTDAIVHLAGMPTEATWPVIREANIEGVVQCFEAARRHGVARVVFASSNHAAGFTPPGQVVPADIPVRPDTLYGVSKAFGEALGRYYADRYGLAVACLRIGSCDWTPPDERALATWLSPDDCGRLVDACLRSAALRYAIVWGVSANTRRWWSLEAGRALGYEPVDDAERYAGSVPPGPASDLLGGGYTSAEYGIDEVAARG